MEKILEILAANIPGLEVALVGTWIWVSGSTKEQAPLLGKNGLKLSWHSKRKMWFFNCETERRYYSKKGFDELTDKYGYKKFSKANSTQVLTA
jgi:hypothetical protein